MESVRNGFKQLKTKSMFEKSLINLPTKDKYYTKNKEKKILKIGGKKKENKIKTTKKRKKIKQLTKHNSSTTSGSTC